jgi:hypothetical protein
VKGEYIIRIGASLHTFYDYNDIPLSFDNVISFLPESKEGPHTAHDHEELHKLNDMLKELLKREKR